MDRFVRRSNFAARREPPDAVTSKSSEHPRSEPQLKRPRIEQSKSGGEDEESSKSVGFEGEGEESGSPYSLALSRHDSVASDPEPVVDEVSTPELENETTIESSLPPINADRDSINEYESLRASQSTEDKPPLQVAGEEKPQQWARGKSSIYVDAFNLALDTVLEDEAHLFDEKERAVFETWKSLGYETQYL